MVALTSGKFHGRPVQLEGLFNESSIKGQAFRAVSVLQRFESSVILE
jgi:hypothetical protein